MRLPRSISCAAPATIVALLGSACGSLAATDTPPRDANASVLVQSLSQKELTELRIHLGSDYRDAKDVLEQPMRYGEKLVFYGTGSWWVTAYGEFHGRDEIVALSTQEPIVLARGLGYTLEIHDTFFRIFASSYLAPDAHEHPIVGDPDLPDPP